MRSNPITIQELEQFRQETSGVSQKIHFNNAGTSFPPNVVVDTVMDYLKEEALVGGYEIEAKYQHQLEHTYQLIARLINAQPDEIALTENASAAWGLAFNGIDFKKGDVIITSEMEYVTNLLGFLHIKKTHDLCIEVIPNDENGNFSVEALENAITPKTKLIAITHIASTGGALTPISAIGKIAAQHRILYLVDACQSIGHVPLDVKEINCDILSVTGRKYLRAPRGTGFLYVRKQALNKIKPFFMDGHSAHLLDEQDYELRKDARRFELYEKNRAITLGLAKAVEYALIIGVDRIWQRIQQLAAYMRQQLNTISFITIHDAGDQLSGIVTFSVNEMDSTLVKNKLLEKNINVSVAQARSTLLYMNRHQLSSIVRASVHYYNTEEEIRQLCEALKVV